MPTEPSLVRSRSSGSVTVYRTVPTATFGWLQLDKPPPGVVEAEHRFAQRRLAHLSQWQPTKAEFRRLQDLVNRRAGRELL
jgi:hypothetical protein